MCRIKQGIMRYTILCQIWQEINNFLTIFKVEAIFLLAKQIKRIYFYNKEDNFYTNNIGKIDLIDILNIWKSIKNKWTLRIYTIFTLSQD